MTNLKSQKAAARKRRQSSADGNGITKEQWAQIAEELQSYFCRVDFKYQDTVITVTRERISENRTGLTVYFDGKICGGWGHKNGENYHPLTPLFWFEKRKRYYSAKRVADIEKSFGKRDAKKYFPNLHDSMSVLVPFFSSSANLIRKLKKADGLVWMRNEESVNDQP